MRLWSLHPKYLDAKGLMALWREALLAQAVLLGQTRGYKHHPQLERFSCHATPATAIAAYLAAVHAEATARGYLFNHSKIGAVHPVPALLVSTSQLQHEWEHLLTKLAARSPACYEQWREITHPICHPLFQLRDGGVEAWERVPPSTS